MVYDWASEHELHCHDVEACACVTRIVRTNGVYDLASDRDIERHDVGCVCLGSENRQFHPFSNFSLPPLKKVNAARHGNTS